MLNTTQVNDLQLDADVTVFGVARILSAGHQGDRQDGAAAMECAFARRVLVHGGRASLCGCRSSTAAWWPLSPLLTDRCRANICASTLYRSHLATAFEFWLAPFDMFESRLPST
jgi:hypothetical protein